ncbi:hypothetical protein HK098_002655 [Nowakowskiella sp. JEL0407]|nr:hypothetical protein HK098_002655 [Nowakowskiella sp. JEL0407]
MSYFHSPALPTTFDSISNNLLIIDQILQYLAGYEVDVLAQISKAFYKHVCRARKRAFGMQRKVRWFVSDVTGLVKLLEQNKGFISGSLVLQSLVAETYPTSDMDVYCSCFERHCANINEQRRMHKQLVSLYASAQHKKTPHFKFNQNDQKKLLTLLEIYRGCPIANFLMQIDGYDIKLAKFGRAQVNLDNLQSFSSSKDSNPKYSDIFQNHSPENIYHYGLFIVTKLSNNKGKCIDVIHPLLYFLEPTTVYAPIVQHYSSHVMNVWPLDYNDLSIIGSLSPQHTIGKIGIVIPPLKKERNVAPSVVLKYGNRGFVMMMYSKYNNIDYDYLIQNILEEDLPSLRVDGLNDNFAASFLRVENIVDDTDVVELKPVTWRHCKFKACRDSLMVVESQYTDMVSKLRINPSNGKELWGVFRVARRCLLQIVKEFLFMERKYLNDLFAKGL